MSLSRKSILVIEDDVDLCNSILSTLYQNGFAPIGVTEVRDATFRLRNQQFACIVLDIRLGTESGEELLEFIHNEKGIPNVKTPILVASGNLNKDLIKRMAGRISGAIVKPFDVASLLESINNLLKK